MRREYLRNVSHEFRTPLTVVRGLQRVPAGGRPRSRRSADVLRVMVESCDRVIDMVDTLIDVSRIEQGEAEGVLQVQDLDLREVASASVEMLRAAAEKKKRRAWSSTCPTTGARCRATAACIHQVVRKLVDNAVKYSEPGGAGGGARARPSEREVTLEVEDGGIGIAPEHLPRIFEKFYMVDGGHRAARGRHRRRPLPGARDRAAAPGAGSTVDSQPGPGQHASRCGCRASSRRRRCAGRLGLSARADGPACGARPGAPAASGAPGARTAARRRDAAPLAERLQRAWQTQGRGRLPGALGLRERGGARGGEPPSRPSASRAEESALAVFAAAGRHAGQRGAQRARVHGDRAARPPRAVAVPRSSAGRAAGGSSAREPLPGRRRPASTCRSTRRPTAPTGSTLRFEDFELALRKGTPVHVAAEPRAHRCSCSWARPRCACARRPPRSSEQLASSAARPELRERVRAAFVRIHPGGPAPRAVAGALHPDPEGARDLAAARAFYDEQVARSFVLDTSLPRSPWWLFPGLGDAAVTLPHARGAARSPTRSARTSPRASACSTASGGARSACTRGPGASTHYDEDDGRAGRRPRARPARSASIRSAAASTARTRCASA